MNRKDILETAELIVNGARQDDYGSAADSFASIAASWTWWLQHPVTAHDVAQMMTLLKLSRCKTSPEKADSYIDACGYQALAAEIKDAK